MHGQQQSDDGFPSFADTVNLTYSVSLCAAMLARPVIRSGFGSQVPGFPGLFAFLTLLVCSAGDGAVGLYFLLWLAALFAHRIAAARRWRRGDHIHSHYPGYAWAGSFFGLIRKEMAARRMEFVPCVVMAGCAAPFSELLATLLLAATVGTVVAGGMEAEAVVRQLRRARDGRIAASNFTDMLRNEREYF